MIESWRCDGVAMGPNARVRPTVTPVQRSNGVSPTPNPRGVEGRDLLLCPPVLGSRTEHIPPLVCAFLVEGYYWAANSAPGGASRRPIGYFSSLLITPPPRPTCLSARHEDARRL